MNLYEFLESKLSHKVKTIVVYPGGFQPPHSGHLATYKLLQKEFPKADVYVYTSNSTDKRPFSFNEKKALWNAAGVSKVIECKGRMYSAKDFARDAGLQNQESYAIVFAISDKEKDRLNKKDFHTIEDKNNLNDITRNAYQYIISKPDEDKSLSGTKIRNAIESGDFKSIQNIIPYSIETLKNNLPAKYKKQYTEDDASATHYLHLEQLATMPNGIERAIEIIEKITDDLNFQNKTIKVDYKIDGSPSFIVGIDPSDKKFFVAYKGSMQSKEPKLFKKSGDATKMLEGKEQLANIYENLFKYLSPLIKKNIYQGDVMFIKGSDKSQKIETVDNEKCVTFYPNTIKYAIPQSSTSLFKEISNAKIGIGLHTKLNGKDIKSLSPKFGVELEEEGLKSTPNVFMMDANIKNITNDLKAPAQLKTSIDNKIKILKSLKLSESDFEKIKPFISAIEPYINSVIKNPNIDIDLTVQKMLNSIKEKSKQGLKSQKAVDQRETIVSENYSIIKKMLLAYKILWQIKISLVNYFNSLGTKFKTMMKMPNGDFKVSPVEGFVAINTGKNRVVKLVDRLNFSRNNFIKNNG